MYHHHYPQNQFMSEEEADYRNHAHPHPYNRYYETPYMAQPMVQRFMIPHLPQQRPMMIAPHKNYAAGNEPQYMSNKMRDSEVACGVQDENINIFNVKTNPQAECTGVNRKGISKKNNTPKNIVHAEKENKQCQVSKAKIQKKQQGQRVPLKKMVHGNREVPIITPTQMIFSSDPLIGSIQQFFPSMELEDQLSTDNATLEQLDQLVKKLPFFYNHQMRDTMKRLTHKQEKLVCNKIKEYKPIDVFDEISKISPDFDLKGLSIEQLNNKLQQINIKFEEQQLKYQLQKQQEKEAYLKQQEEENIQILREQQLLLRISQTCAVNKSEVESQMFIKQNHTESIKSSIPSSTNIVLKEEEFNGLSKTQEVLNSGMQTLELNANLEERMNQKKETCEINTQPSKVDTIQESSIFACTQYSSPKQDKGFSEAMSEEKKIPTLASSNDSRRIRMRRNSESTGHSGSRSRSQVHGINGNQNLANTFISPFRPNISTNIQGLSSNRKKLLEKSGSSACSSFKKSHSQFMDYIDDVMINTDGNFGEDDIFHKLGNDNVTIFPHNSNNNKLVSNNKRNRNTNNIHSNYLMHHNNQGSANQLHHHHHHPHSHHSNNNHHLDSNDSYNANKKKYFDCNRIHNFIAEEEDYESVQPFIISQFGGSNSKQFTSNSMQQILTNSNQKSYHQNSTTYNISSFLREIDEINTFSQPGFL